MAKPGQNAGVRMPKARPFHDAPVPLGLGSVGGPTECHFSPTAQLVGGGQEDEGDTPQDRLGHSHFSHGQVLGPQVLKIHLKKRTKVPIAWQKLWCLGGPVSCPSLLLSPARGLHPPAQPPGLLGHGGVTSASIQCKFDHGLDFH